MEAITLEEIIAESQDRIYTRNYDEAGNPITEWDEEKGWFEDGTEQLETGEWVMKRVYHLYTDEQLAEKEIEKEKAALLESRRTLTLEEVTALFIKQQANVIDIPDHTSLRMKDYYPAFSEVIGQTVKMGFKFTYDGELYKTLQENLLMHEHYPPGTGTESLYVRIDLEHTGAVYDPIPYNGNMELFKGKYYIQDNTTYLCTRDSGTALYHTLKDLINLYVEMV